MKASPSGERAAAIAALAKWLRTGLFPDRLVPEGHPLAMEILLGTLRNLRAADWAVARFCRKPPGPLPKAALLVGAWQLLFAESVPDYAAVSETVAAARLAHAGAPAFVNAVLRAIARERAPLLAELAAAPLALRTSHPDELVRRWTSAYGDEAAAAACAADNLAPSPTAVPLPFLDGDAPARLLARWREAGIDARPCPADQAAIVLPHACPVERLPGYAEGAFAIQDPATLAALRLLAPQSGEAILDACAAPGGKALQLAAAVGPTGRVIALDASSARLGRLRENAARARLDDRLEIGQADAASPDLADVLGGRRPDAILADVPCSNSGVLRRRPDARWRWSPEETSRLARLQLAILSNLAALGAGRIVYSTCSIDPVENEEVVTAFLSSPAGTGYALAGTRCLLPSPDADGAFAARLVRSR